MTMARGIDDRSDPVAGGGGLWQWGAVLASIGALSGSLVAVIVHDITGLKRVAAMVVGVALAACFVYVLHRIGLLLARTVFKRPEREGGVAESDTQSWLAKLAFASLLVWFAAADWVGYAVVNALFGGA